MGGAISSTPPNLSGLSTSSAIKIEESAKVDLDAVESSTLMQTDGIEIKVIEQQSALFQQCIADVTKKLCRELANLRANNKKLNDELEQQRKKNKKTSRKLTALQTKYNKLQDDLEYQKSLVSDKSDKIDRLESGFDLSKFAGLSKNNSFSLAADKVLKRKHNHEVSKTDLPPVLRGFTPLKKIESVSSVIESADLKNAENMFLKKPKSAVSMRALNKHVNTVYKKLKAAIANRLRTPNILEDCRLTMFSACFVSVRIFDDSIQFRKVEQSGNASFLQVTKIGIKKFLPNRAFS